MISVPSRNWHPDSENIRLEHHSKTLQHGIFIGRQLLRPTRKGSRAESVQRKTPFRGQSLATFTGWSFVDAALDDLVLKIICALPFSPLAL
ncbi:unnamed protein product [Protopolystoma xenopodis]|uniref:Uncharacterized protein n=1 Tax=Protopolystoma xenopodis TaxID=117903 RepID=A0A448XEF4_9PLAT|nr:unnamed protein product [Protopolystoma xenopodis]